VSKTDNYDIKSYDVYNKGYKSGAQAFVFLGPIWIEETSFFQIDRSDTKKPVYGYNEVKYDRLLQGRYLVQGTLGINYVESNYLTKTIKEIQDQSIMKGTLQDLIVNRKNILSQSLQKMAEEYGIDTSGNKDINSFVQRLCNEAELASSSNGQLDPNNFELTFVFGDLYDTTQSIEIYEGVQIASSGIRSGNDDSVTIEIYNWTARGMKETEIPAEKDIYQYGLSKANLLQMAKEVSDALIENLLDDPEIIVSTNRQRTRLMDNTMRLGVAGLLHPKTRMFGRNGSFIEMVYAVSFPMTYGANIQSKTKMDININKKGSDVSSKVSDDIYLMSPTQTIANKSTTAFDNSFGRMVSVNREHTAEKIKAISPVVIEPLVSKLGGSIALPMYQKSSFNLGSFIPPSILENTIETPYVFTESDITSITYSTLWCCLTGYRGIGGSNIENSQEDPGEYINEVSQPLYSFSYIKEVSVEYIQNGEYSLKISTPTYIDFMNIHKTHGGCKRSKLPIIEAPAIKNIEFKYDKDGVIISKGISDSPTEDEAIFEESIIFSSYRKIEDIQMIDPETIITGPELDDFKPYFFEFTIDNTSAKLASDFHKSLYLVPFIFYEKEDEELPNIPGVLELFMDSGLPTNKVIQNLAYLLSNNQGNDASCNYDMDYDWVCTDVSGVLAKDGKIKVNGVYFINPKSAGLNGKNVHIIWVMSLLPIARYDMIKNKDLQIIQDISVPGGRYAEFYNITRCDNMHHVASNYELYNPDNNIIQNIWAGIKDIWDGLRNILFNASYEYNYAMPHKTSISRLCGFMDGYAITLNINNIIDQILKCEFTKPDYIRSAMGSDHNGVINLESALKRASAINNNAQSKIREEISEIVNNSINDKIEIKGANIITDINNGSVTIEIQVPIPPTDLISYGILTDGSGADVLLDIKKQNQAYQKDPSAKQGTATNNNLTLGAYSDVI